MLFTGKGDKGDTYFFGSNERSPKSSIRAEALGSMDEINSLIGLCRAKAAGGARGRRKRGRRTQGTEISKVLEMVQQDLFIIQAHLAGADKNITQEKIRRIEHIIASIEAELPPIKTFFLPGATELGGLLDYARAVARRAERMMVRYAEEQALPPEILAYVNRLSSLLYALARLVNFKAGAQEIPPSY